MKQTEVRKIYIEAEGGEKLDKNDLQRCFEKAFPGDLVVVRRISVGKKFTVTIDHIVDVLPKKRGRKPAQ